MTFDQFPYQRPDLAALTKSFDKHLAAFQKAPDAVAQGRSLRRLSALKESFATMYNLCYIRHSSDTTDAFYEAEDQFFNANMPTFEALNNRFFEALLQAPFRETLEAKHGPQLFTLAELSLKTFKPSIMEALQQENELTSEYIKIKAQAKIEFDGTTYNLASLYPFEISPDRDVRRRATTAKWAFFADQTTAIEGIFDKMVKLRHQMAQELGYKNFVEVGYARMRRSDYTPDMVANFRRQVRDLIVPINTELYERQRRRLGLDKLKSYDEDFRFPSGNPRPQGTPDDIVANAARMYRELSPDTDTFFQFMQDNRLMDLVNRDGKATGGYCTFLSKFKAPFIFSNFNGTSGDIDVLTHEAGHAFQVWSSSKFPFEEYLWPTSDAAEIHSMSMEYLTWPWMHLFFGADTDKYYFMHLTGSLKFLPYGVAVDEFQHIIYENPDMTPAERNAAWRQLEKTYLPHRDYDGNTYLEEGRFWQRQNHIFSSPFYYIDYTLAQICAFQFWTRDRQNHKSTWHDYRRLCKAGGSKSFLGLVKLANLRSPFEDGCVASVIGEIEQYLAGVNDEKW
jgi:M3 family oligoendopeptidase